MKYFLLRPMIILAIILGVNSNLAAAYVFIETVPVGDTNNVADPLTGYGAVKDGYRIGRTEVTAMQYCSFLNAVAKYSDPYSLYNPQMGTDPNVASIQQTYDSSHKCYLFKTIKGADDFPITYVDWSSAARFCNWLHNDQPEGSEGPDTTERGAYNLDGFMGGVVPVAKDAAWFLPSEDQWYKAAYYKGGGMNAGYWIYPTQHNIDPDNSIIGKNRTNNANVFIVKTVKNWYGELITQETHSKSSAPFLTPVNTFTNSAGYYGTYDMGGNVFEWVDADRASIDPDFQVVRGGAWSKEFGVSSLESTCRNATNSFSSETSAIGFRVAKRQERLTLSWVVVGDPGNPPDSATGHGAVNDVFKIGKYPITAEQFKIFLNSVASNSDPYGLYSPWIQNDPINGSINCTPIAGHFYYSVKPGRKNFPINHVSWFDAARFCNWIQNGCREGNEDDSTTETGAYTLHGLRPSVDNPPVPVNENAQYYIPSEDQWYKAAYYNGSGGYHDYPTESGVVPGNTIGGEGDQANYNNATTGTLYAASSLTPVDLFKRTKSYYGAYDMGGNIWEWNSTTMSFFGMVKIQGRGGSFRSPCSDLKKENNRFFFAGQIDTGFRIAAPMN
ncbi:MAG: formylglycine-generating enzyme family protein [Chthoniobacterales bacterium]|nr:formylglycine-generating enzyme family protein [Chthoniobacterales bacterium]